MRTGVRGAGTTPAPIGAAAPAARLPGGGNSRPYEFGLASSRIADGFVRLTAKYCGRGPTRARTTLTEALVAVVLEDALTRAEQTLAAAGEHDHVREHRAKLHRIMRAEAIALVEAETGRRVHSYLCETCPETGVVVHTLLLRPDLVEVA